LKRPWIRLYTDVPTNIKVQRLPGDLFKFWINCLCLSSEDGGLPTLESIAFSCRLRPHRVREYLEKLVEAHLIDKDLCVDGALSIHAWDERQYTSDGSADRVRAYRDRIKQAGRTPGAYTQHRAAIFERDQNHCIYCGSLESLCIDHVIPLIKGGDDHLDNLATACKKCNSGKSGRTPEEANYEIISRAYLAIHRRNLNRLNVTPVTVTVTPSEQSRADTETDTEQSRADVARAPTFLKEPSGYAFDEQYVAFREVWKRWQPATVDPDDFFEAWPRWKVLDGFQKADTIKVIEAKIAAREDPLSRLPKNYLAGPERKRPPRQKPLSNHEIEMQRIMDSI
jgi:5-methylcytosine-specific restriction endonuclease McrA